jgi:hypothetical protein
VEAAAPHFGPLPDVLDLDKLERDSIFTCRDQDGVVYPRHLSFQFTVYTETDDSNGPIIGRMCPRCGYWAGSLALAKEGIVVRRWPQ